MMIYKKNSKTFGSKGMFADIKKVKIDSNIQQCFCVFDLVYLNGENLCNTPLKDRKLRLQKVVTSLEGVIMVSSYRSVFNKQGILNELNTSMDNKEEGIVFKSPCGVYLPNERIGWWKVKLEYFEGVMSDLDVVIIGGYYGQGATKGEITGYLVAVKDKNENKYLSFAKISTGLNREETKELNTHLNPHWRNDPHHEKSNIILGKEKPDKWIPPSKSKCLQVRGSELIKLYDSTTVKDYATKYTLRFPRILCLRLDKNFDDCLTTDELTSLTEGSSVVQKLNKRHLELEDLVIPSKPSKRRKKELNFELLPVDIVSDILLGYTFVVLTGIGDWTKDMVEKAVRENGGTLAIDCTPDTLCMLVGDDHIRTQTYTGEVDIVKVDWLRHVLNEGEFMMYEPFDVVKMSEKSKRRFMQEFDHFGDSYVIPADKTSLKKVFNEYLKSNYNVMQLTVDEINEFNAEINFTREWKVLRGYTAFFDRYKIINDTSSTEISYNSNFYDRVAFKNAGGIESEFLNEDCDCIIASIDRFEEVQVYLQSLRRDIPIYSSTEEFKQEILRRGQQQ
ncbi:DNA ligase 4 [Atheta coriaria]|uniref:DNA ligase 4 n=1 Tax=Dalotia coriaria TaxID=877792 RepID=UPI0031F35695